MQYYHEAVLYIYLSHALKNTANQRPGLPLHILLYAMGNMQWVVFYFTLPSLLEILKHLKNIFELFPKISGNFRTLPKIFRKFLKPFWTVFEVFQKFPKIAKDFPKFSHIV